MLSNVLPLVVIRLITIFTDICTFLRIKFSSKQHSSTYHEESHHTCCNDQSIYKQKLDIPFKSTSFSYVIFALLCISFFLQKISVLPYSNMVSFAYWSFPIAMFFTLNVNIPLIVCLSKKQF